MRHTELLAYAGYLFTFAVVPSLVSSLGSWVMWLAVITYCWVALARCGRRALPESAMTCAQSQHLRFPGTLLSGNPNHFTSTAGSPSRR